MCACEMVHWKMLFHGSKEKFLLCCPTNRSPIMSCEMPTRKIHFHEEGLKSYHAAMTSGSDGLSLPKGGGETQKLNEWRQNLSQCNPPDCWSKQRTRI
jgi:hypothetical protein